MDTELGKDIGKDIVKELDFITLYKAHYCFRSNGLFYCYRKIS